MIESILIANRGEIACRVIRTCKQLGIRSIAVYSDADTNALHVKLADEAVYIGASEVKSSYLNIDKILDAAKKAKAQAIHPGYGFLSENGTFAKRLEAEGIIFIGPNANAIEWMGSKSKAKEIAGKHDVPLVPGYQGEDQTLERFSKEAALIGFPVLLKATAGGGGKGMRIVHELQGLPEAFAGAKREALSAFGNDELLIEKYFFSARHIEMQIFGDKHGNAIYLLERECTIQRRYQKIFEESPSPVLTEVQRNEMGKAAVRLAKALNYDNAGTVEFIYSEGKFYFLEVNTRLQVEHPVTEAITGLDLVQLQIEVAEGKALTIQQSDIKANGYALECRIYAEDAANSFLPTTGKILTWETPVLEGLRYDSGIESGSEISIYYDPMICKVIAHAPDRITAIRRMNYALRNLVCLGTTTNHAFLLDVLARREFAAGDYDTHFIALHMDTIQSSQYNATDMNNALIAATLHRWQHNEAARTGLKSIQANWRNNFYQPSAVSFTLGADTYKVQYTNTADSFSFQINGTELLVKLVAASTTKVSAEIDGRLQHFNLAVHQDKYYVQHFSFPQIQLQLAERFPFAEKEKVKGGYTSPMPANVIKVLVAIAQQVKSGQSLLIISSMKMENTIIADEDGIVSEIYVAEGENIEAGKLLLKITDNA
jgi:acetyl-CoA carboxylase biotin carboxylase subunit